MNLTIKEKKEYMVKTIKKFWFGYKVCEGCSSLVYEEVGVCPICKVYRFDNTKKTVHKIAEKMLTDEFFILPEECTASASKGYSDLNSEKE